MNDRQQTTNEWYETVIATLRVKVGELESKERALLKQVELFQSQLPTTTAERDRLKEAMSSLSCEVCKLEIQAALRGEGR